MKRLFWIIKVAKMDKYSHKSKRHPNLAFGACHFMSMICYEAVSSMKKSENSTTTKLYHTHGEKMSFQTSCALGSMSSDHQEPLFSTAAPSSTRSDTEYLNRRCVHQSGGQPRKERAGCHDGKDKSRSEKGSRLVGTADDKSIRALYHFKRIADSASKYAVDTEIDHLVLVDYSSFDVALITGASSEDLQRSFSRVPQQVACIGINPTRCTPVQEILRGSDCWNRYEVVQNSLISILVEVVGTTSIYNTEKWRKRSTGHFNTDSERMEQQEKLGASHDQKSSILKCKLTC
jgi:hypothetical protein